MLPALAMIGCMKEDMSDCGALRFEMRFIRNAEGVDRLATDVGDARIYMFDKSSGVLSRIVEVSPADIARGYVEVANPDAGLFTCVAWGGDGEELSESGFMEVSMSNPATHSYDEGIEVGVTTLDNFYMMIEHDELPAAAEGEVAPKTSDFDDLFFASASDVHVDRGEKEVAKLDFIRNTNVLKVTVSGLENLPAQGGGTRADSGAPLDIWALGENGRYRVDNTIDDDARLVQYQSPDHALSDNSMWVDLKTLRLDLERHDADDPVRLRIDNGTTGDKLVDLDVLKAIGQVKGEDGAPLYGTQDQIDRQYEFPINIVLDESSRTGELYVRIFIDEWEIITPDPEF
jgi:hypothetical protein